MEGRLGEGLRSRAKGVGCGVWMLGEVWIRTLFCVTGATKPCKLTKH